MSKYCTSFRKYLILMKKNLLVIYLAISTGFKLEKDFVEELDELLRFIEKPV